MQYRNDRYGNPISLLGFGCMRLPSKLGRIDMEEAEREIMAAIRAGVNYFDTAYIYPGSEAALGEILKRNGVRDQVNIATKLPHYLIRSREGLDKLFAEELARLKTDHIDYYLMHMLTGEEAWARLCSLGILEWLEEKKKAGAIRQVGFSYHGNSDTYCRLLDCYDWDFSLIQYNYMDEHSQAGRRGLQYAHSKGLPVMIMEPLRGGKLVSRLPQEAKDIFSAHPVRHTPAQWAFRWLFDQEAVTCVLSGMNSMEMVEDNIATASAADIGCMTADDQAMLRRVCAAINAKMRVGCTGCGYCMPCPKGVDIPGTFAAYNRRYSENRFWSFVDYTICTALRRTASSASECVSCGLCEKHCPQQIAIRKELKAAARELESPLYRLVRGIVRRLKLF